VNHVFLLAKYFIFEEKCQKPYSSYIRLENVKNKQLVEEVIASIKNRRKKRFQQNMAIIPTNF